MHALNQAPAPQPAKHSLRRRLRYRFDTMLARGTIAVIAWLGVLTLVVVVVSGLIVSVADVAIHHSKHPSIIEGIWQNMMRALEPAAMHEDEGWPLRLQSLFVVLFGVFVVSSLIGLVASGIDRRVGELRKGRSPVLEEGHTLVLGWSAKAFTVITELVLAQRDRRDSCIVLMAPHDKAEMEDELRLRIRDLHGTRIVVRRGDPSDPADLALVNPYESASVIVLGNHHEDGDAQVIRAVLALMKDRRFEDLRLVVDCAYDESAQLLRSATKGHALTIASSDVIARVTAQACRHAGLGRVFQEILDFEEEDIQFDTNPALVGERFGDLVQRYEKAALMGVRLASGRVVHNPSDDLKLAAGDQAILLADGSSNLTLSSVPMDVPQREWLTPTLSVVPKHILIAGWNPLAPRILRELDKWVAPGSTIRALVDEALIRPEETDVPGLQNLTLNVTRTKAWSPTIVAELAAAEHYEKVVVLCYRQLTTDEADARALSTLLQLQQFRAAGGEASANMSVVTEVLDIHDVELARAAGADDFIVSERLTALDAGAVCRTAGARGCFRRPLRDYGLGNLHASSLRLPCT